MASDNTFLIQSDSGMFARATAGKVSFAIQDFAAVSMAGIFTEPVMHQAASDNFANTLVALNEITRLGYRRIGFFFQSTGAGMDGARADRRLSGMAAGFAGGPARGAAGRSRRDAGRGAGVSRMVRALSL